MIRLLFLAMISLGLVACGNDEGGSTEAATDEMTTATHENPADMAEAPADDAMAEMPSEEPMESAMDTLATMQAAYLADYAIQDGTVLTDSGLMYQVVRAGEGASPLATDIVEVHYEGRLVDGTVFDSSYERDETIEFPLNRVIAGWTEGLQYMQPGAEHILVIPPHLGYGDRGAGEVVPPDAVLIFRVELFNVTPGQ